MKKVISLLLVLAMTACFAFSVSAAATNIIGADDSGFENGVGAWTAFGGTVTFDASADTFHSGAKSLKVTARQYAWTSPALNVRTQLEAGGAGVYTGVAYVKLVNAADEGQTGDIGSTRMLFRFSSAGADNLGIGGDTATPLLADEWTQLIGTFEITQAMLDNGNPLLICFDNGTSDLYIDDVTLYEGDVVEELSGEDVVAPTADPNATKAPTENTADFSSIAYAVAAISGLGALVIRKKK